MGQPQPVVPPRYEAVTVRCHGCEATSKVEEDIPNDQHGVYTRLMPTLAEPEEDDDE